MGGGMTTGGGMATGGGSAVGGGGAIGDAGVPVSEFCDRIAYTQCSWVASCGKIDPGEVGLCISELKPFCDARMQNALHGGPGYDPLAGARCLASIPSNDCAFYFQFFGEGCLELAISDAPRLDAGQRCALDRTQGECASGYCLDPGAAACGVCTPLSAATTGLGEPCDTSAHHCVAGAFCHHIYDGGVDRCEPTQDDGELPVDLLASCTSGTVSIAADGGWVCGRLPPGAACLPYAKSCDPAHFCDEGSNTCSTRAALGQPCSNQHYDDGCEGDATCLDGLCQLAPFGSRDSGAECETTGQCHAADRCVFDGGTAAARSGVCAPRLSEGAPCFDNNDCIVTTLCLHGHCAPLGGLGDICDFSCKPVYDCRYPGDGGPGRCAPPPVIGEHCDGRCLNPDGGLAACTSDGGHQIFTCTSLLPAGARCESTVQCEGRRCENGGAGDYICKPGCWP